MTSSRLSLADWEARVRAKPKIEDLVTDLIPGTPGYSLIAGPAGLGKTNLGLNFAVSLAAGTDLLWFNVPKPRSVGMLTFEGSEENLLDRESKLISNYTTAQRTLIYENMHFERWPSTYINFQQSRDKIISWGQGLDLLILDPIKNMVAKDPSKPEVAHQFLEHLKWLYETLKCHVLLMHHVHKMDAEFLYSPMASDLQALKGSTEYGDSAETVIMMRRVQSRAARGQFGNVVKDQAYLTLAKVRNQAEDIPDEKLIAFDRATLQWTDIVL